MQRHHDLIKVTFREIGKVYKVMFETTQIILGVTDKVRYQAHIRSTLKKTSSARPKVQRPSVLVNCSIICRCGL